MENFENYVEQKLGWPTWALRTIEVLAALLCVTAIFPYLIQSEKSEAKSAVKPTTKFRWFQVQYLSVFLITMLADWLQGTHMYTLYMVSYV